MLILLSPAKKQLKEQSAYQGKTTEPVFYDETLMLLKALKKLSQSDIAKLMKLSDALADDTFQAVKNFTKAKKSPAIFMFQGAAYQTLQAEDFTQTDLNYVQDHLIILTGMFGLLKPLDLIQHYRLDMGTSLKTSKGKNLYEFWDDKITNEINKSIKKHKHEYVINLASTEYFSAVNFGKLDVDVITVDFKDLKNGAYKIIGTNAKRARGMMTRYILKNRIETLAELKKFSGMDYKFDKDLSKANHYVFVRG